MKHLKYVFAMLLLLSSAFAVQAQETSDLVEVYGLIITKNDASGKFEYVPFATIGIKGTTRGSYANYEGMYSIVVKKGQTLSVSALGYKKQEVTVPTDIDGLYYSLTIPLEEEAIVLEEITVFPWPDRNNLAAEFLALEPSRAMQLENIAKENLDKNDLLAITNATSPDARESASHYLRKQTREYSYQGQTAPQAIFDPLAWNRFFKQWKKKELTEKEKKMIEMLENE